MPTSRLVEKTQGAFVLFRADLLLFAILWCADVYAGAGAFLQVMVPVALLCCALPWGVVILCCYVPFNAFLRASLSVLFGAGWLWLLPGALVRTIEGAIGPADPASMTDWPLRIPLNLADWSAQQAACNVFGLILFVRMCVSAFLALAGCRRARRG